MYSNRTLGAKKLTNDSLAVIEHLRVTTSNVNAAVAFVYCDYRDQLHQTIVNLIGSLANQLVLQVHSIPTAIWEIYKRMAMERKPVNLESTQAVFRIILQQFECVYICIDALDECQPEVR